MSAATLLRWLAIAIAVVAVFDPAITSRRRVDAVVAVIAADTSVAALTNEVERELARTFTVVRAPFAAAAATILVGTHLPDDARHSGGAAFTVLPVADGTVKLEQVRAPQHASLHSRVTVVAAVRGSGRADVALLQGDVALDHASVELSARAVLDVRLTFVPTQTGALPLRVVVSDNAVQTRSDVLVDVRDTRWSVLFYEPRPSWMSTFVRRALEQDPRFLVTSRTVTSRNVAIEYGRPPRRLDELANGGDFDVLVIGAPEVLTDAEMAHVERYLRRSGGSAVLLLDRPVAGAYRRIAGPGPWMSSSAVTRPETMPPRAMPVALRPDGPAIWRVPVGAGRLIVSGALDAWRFRDPETSQFDVFWRGVIADAAAAAPAALDATLQRAVVRPGEKTSVTVSVRDAVLADSSSRVRVGASIEENGASIRLWPGDRKGELIGRFRAPDAAGSYAVVITDGTERISVPLEVRADAAVVNPAERELLRAWAASRSGATVEADHVDELPSLVEAAVSAERRAEVWHPMRSPWWILPFALALGAEWWARRRRGLP